MKFDNTKQKLLTIWEKNKELSDFSTKKLKEENNSKEYIKQFNVNQSYSKRQSILDSGWDILIYKVSDNGDPFYYKSWEYILNNVFVKYLPTLKVSFHVKMRDKDFLTETPLINYIFKLEKTDNSEVMIKYNIKLIASLVYKITSSQANSLPDVQARLALFHSTPEYFV